MRKIIAIMETLVIVLGIIIPSLEVVWANEQVAYSGESVEEEYISVSDIFYGYSGVLNNPLFLRKYEGEMQGTLAAVQSEYVNTLEFKASAVFGAVKDATKTSEIIKLYSDNIGLTEFEHSEHLDAANAKFVKELCADEYIDMNDIDTVNKYLKVIEKLASFGEKLETFRINCDSYVENKKSPKTYSDFFDWTFANIKEYCTYIDPDDFETLKTKYSTYFATVTDNLEYTIDAFEFTKGLITSIIMYDLQMEIVHDIVEYADSNSMLYQGMKRYMLQLQAGFITTYGIDMLKEETIGAMAKIMDSLINEKIGDTNKVRVNIVKTALVLISDISMWVFDLSSTDNYFVSTILGQYAYEMYDYVRNKSSVFDGIFISNEIVGYQKCFEYCMVASKLALEEAKGFAKYNDEYDEMFVEESLEKFDGNLYSEYIASLRDTLNKGGKDNYRTQAGNESNYEIINNQYQIAQASDVIEVNKIYLFENQVFTGIELDNSNLNIIEDEKMVINGTVMSNESSLIINKGILEINGDAEISGTEFINEGQLVVYGNLNSKNAKINNSGELTVGKDCIVNSQQNIYNSNVISVYGNMTLQGQSEVFITHDMYMYQTGGQLNVYGDLHLLHNSYIECTDEVVINVKGDITLAPGWGVTANRDCAIRIESGQIHCGGNIIEVDPRESHGIIELGEDVELYASGDILFSSCESCLFEKGKVIMNGEKLQNIKNVTVYNMEVINKNGLGLESDIQVKGKLNMNGNPVVYSDKKILLYNEAELSSGTLYPKLQTVEMKEFDYDIECMELIIEFFDDDVVINKGVNITIYNDFYIGDNNGGYKVLNNGNIYIEGDFFLDYRGDYWNYGLTDIQGALLINPYDSAGWISTADTNYKNYNITYVGGDLIINNAGNIYMMKEEACIYIGGNIKRKSNARKYDFQMGNMVLNGTDTQTISGVDRFGVLEIINESSAGIVFDTEIHVSTLFNHNRNKYTLANEGVGSTFVDYDGDTMNDNVDEYPTVKWGKLELANVDLPEGTYYENKKIELSSRDVDADIYYTLDGSVPSASNGIQYTQPIDIVGVPGEAMEYIVKAIVIKGGMQESEIIEYHYIIELPKLDGPEAPKELAAVSTTDVGIKDGKILGTSNLMEYSMSPDFADVNVCSEGETTNLSAGIYYIRIAETKNTNAGAYVKIEIKEHVHTFSSVWSKDDNSHWHEATCIHTNLKRDILEHIYENYVYNDDATYYTDGTETGRCNCGAENMRVKEGSMLRYTEYEIIQGKNQGITKGEFANIVINTKGDFDKFVNVCIDDKVVNEGNYIVKSDSTIIIFNAQYIRNLPVGRHEIKINFTDGYAIGSVSVELAMEVETDNGALETEANNDELDVEINNETPETGEQSQLRLYVMYIIMFSSAMCCKLAIHKYK